MLETADAIGAKLSYGDIAEKLGYEPSPWYRRHDRQDRRWDAVVGAQEAEAHNANEEYEVGAQLAAWLEDDLTPEERDTIRVQYTGYVDDEMLSPLELVAGEGEHAKIFVLSHHFNFEVPGELPDHLTDEQRARFRCPDLSMLPRPAQGKLERKRDFWETLGVHNGGEICDFVDTYFTRTDIDLDAPDNEQPAEIEWLFAARPDLREALRESAGVRLRKLRGVPPAVREHIHQVSQTQNKTIGWLRPHITECKNPVIGAEDMAAIHTTFEARVEALDADTELSPFRRAVLRAEASNDAAVDEGLTTPLEGIANFATLAHGIEVVIPEDAPREARIKLLDTAEFANYLLDKEFGLEAAVDHMLRDISGHHSQGIVQTLKMAGGLIVTGEALHYVHEHHPEWSALGAAVFMLALLEDPVSEAGEALSQRSLGYSWREILPRYKLIGPVAVGSVLAGLTVEHVGHAYGESPAVLDFAIASCATTGATLYKTLQTSMRAYRKQVAEGKVEDANPNEPVPLPDALKQGWNETFGTNPVRKGKLLGMTAMVAGGPLPPVAHAVFNQAAVTMSFSMGEPAAGIAANYVHKAVRGRLDDRRARKQARQLRARPQAESQTGNDA